MIDIYYPFFEREAAWEELRYSLRSLVTYLEFDFRVVIVGDMPAWMNPESVLYIPHERIEHIKENQLYDAITKQLLFCNHPDTSLRFIRMYDDIYLLDDLLLEDLFEPVAMYPYHKVPQRSGTWWDQLYRTIGMLKIKGYPAFNSETHLPELFNKEKMLFVINAYSALDNRLLTSSLYYNTFFPTIEPRWFSKDLAIQFYNDVDDVFYTNSQGDLVEKCKGKKFLNHNDQGLNENLKRFLISRFPQKSEFEL